jgi:hypothetical protein
VTVLGLLSAAVGVEHAIGDMSQGAVAPPGLVFPSWPDSPAFAPLDGEPALTVLPNLLITGVLAALVSVAIGIWAVLGASWPGWGLGLIGLSVLQLLFGGGFGPPLVGLVAGLLATRAARPSTAPPSMAVSVLARLFPWALVAAVTSFLTLVPGTQLLHLAAGPVSADLVGAVTVTAFVSTGLAVLSARAHDRVACRAT